MEGDSKAGHVGMVIPSCKIKLVDTPELGYFAKDNAGEVCIKYAFLYFKNWTWKFERTNCEFSTTWWV